MSKLKVFGIFLLAVGVSIVITVLGANAIMSFVSYVSPKLMFFAEKHLAFLQVVNVLLLSCISFFLCFRKMKKNS